MIVPAIRFLYSAADEAVIEQSPYFRHKAPEVVSDEQVLELKLASMFIPTNAVILITQTFLHEAPATRLTVTRIPNLIESGMIRMLSPTLNHDDFVLHKRETYANVRDVAKYREAYFTKSVSLPSIPFQYEQKAFSSGSTAHDMWKTQALSLARIFEIETQMERVIVRLEDLDTGNSTWESTYFELQRLNLPKRVIATLHAMSYTTYIDAYRINQVACIVGSRIATYLFTGPRTPHDFDLEPHRRGLAEVHGLELVRNISEDRVLWARRHIEDLKNQGPPYGKQNGYSFYSEVARILRMAKLTADNRNDEKVVTKVRRVSEISFDVALSFPGASRTFVENVYAELEDISAALEVFYDFKYQAQLAAPNLDVVLERIYNEQSQLLVVFLHQEYKASEWCGLEWRVVRNLIKKRESEKIMLIRLDDVDLEGLLSIDGYFDARSISPRDLAEAIHERFLAVSISNP